MNRKAKELAGLLAPPGNKRVWVAEAVCFTDNSLRARLHPAGGSVPDGAA